MTEQRIERIISQLAELSEEELSSVCAEIIKKQEDIREEKRKKAREELLNAWGNFVDLGGRASINNEFANYYDELDFYI